MRFLPRIVFEGPVVKRRSDLLYLSRKGYEAIDKKNVLLTPATLFPLAKSGQNIEPHGLGHHRITGQASRESKGEQRWT